MKKTEDINETGQIKVSLETKYIAKPLGILFLVLLLFAGVTYFGIKQLSNVREKIDKATKVKNVLTEKVDYLNTITTVIPQNLSFISLAVPNENPQLLGLSQIKALATQYGLLLSNIRTGQSSSPIQGVERISILFDVEGDENSVYQLIDSFSTVLPLMKLEKVRINRTAGTFLASIAINTFSSSLPTKIPAITAPLPDLSQEEISILRDIVTFSLPEFAEMTPTEVEARPDPFN